MSIEVWKFEQIGEGVSRVPIDIDQDRFLLEEARKERQAHPLHLIEFDDQGRIERVRVVEE